jgi:hypothetical protein
MYGRFLPKRYVKKGKNQLKLTTTSRGLRLPI